MKLPPDVPQPSAVDVRLQCEGRATRSTSPATANRHWRTINMAKGTCSIEGCDRVVVGRHLCNMHYARWRTHGDPLKVVYSPPPPPRRNTPADFWAKVAVGAPNECWPWMKSCSKRGYGRAAYEDRVWIASRLAWMLTNGDPGELHVLHRCDNPPCVNPAHLFLGTDADNVADMVAKGRSPAPPARAGSAHGMSKLTEADVVSIRALFASGTTGRAISARFGVTPKHVSRIVTRKLWTHL